MKYWPDRSSSATQFAFRRDPTWQLQRAYQQEEVKERGGFVADAGIRAISHRARYCSPALRVAKSLANGRPGEGKRGTCIRFRDGPNEARS